MECYSFFIWLHGMMLVRWLFAQNDCIEDIDIFCVT